MAILRALNPTPRAAVPVILGGAKTVRRFAAALQRARARSPAQICQTGIDGGARDDNLVR
ncbi:MAG: hypothetical protein ACRELS_21185 [Candidatus Rokuibacteriota bacterium]